MAERLRRRGHINWHEVDGDVVAVDGVTGEVHLLRGSVAVVWQLLDGESLTGVEEMVAEAFAIPVDEAASGIGESVAMLHRAGIVDDLGANDAVAVVGSY
jgi:hypothetical protein